MKNKKLLYIAIAAAAIYYFTKKKAVKGIEQQAEKLAKDQVKQIKFGIDRQSMEDIYKEQQFKY